MRCLGLGIELSELILSGVLVHDQSIVLRSVTSVKPGAFRDRWGSENLIIKMDTLFHKPPKTIIEAVSAIPCEICETDLSSEN